MDVRGLLLVLTGILIFILAMWIVLRRQSGQLMTVVEESETKTSEYRQQTAIHLGAVVTYWAGVLLTDINPTIYTSDDYELAYIEYSTQYGLLRFTVNWARQKVHMHYSIHDSTTGLCRDIYRTAPLTRDATIAKFCSEAVRIESKLIADRKSILEDLRDVASDGAQQLKSLPEGDQLVIAMLYASNAMAHKKKPTNEEVTAYVQLVRCVMAYHDDTLSDMLKRFKSQLEDSEQEAESD